MLLLEYGLFLKNKYVNANGEMLIFLMKNRNVQNVGPLVSLVWVMCS